MNHGSLFSGIGGFDLAAEWMGWNNVFHCEINPFGQKALKHYWPNAITYDDITKTDFTIHRRQIDILTGGFPCQPFSVAGKRKGTEDSRNLWPEYNRAISEIQPTWVVGENVPGLINWSGGLVFEQVQADLEAQGYEVWPFVLPACSTGAPHRRDRVWFVAYSANARAKSLQRGKNRVYGQEFTPNPPGTRRKNGEQFGTREDKEKNTTGVEFWNKRLSVDGDASNASHEQPQGSKFNRSITEKRSVKTEIRQFSGSVCGKWEQFPTQSPVCSGDDGISTRLAGITVPKYRNESIKAYGNAIVPQVVYQIFKTINQFNELHR